MFTFKKKGVIHRICYDRVGPSNSDKCLFNLQIKGKGWRVVAKGDSVNYPYVIELLKENDFSTHEEARNILIETSNLH